jgi:hypothetical protein
MHGTFELVPSYSKHAHADTSHLHPWLMSKLYMYRHAIAQYMDCGARLMGGLARLGTCKARARAHIMCMRACRGSDGTGLAHAHAVMLVILLLLLFVLAYPHMQVQYTREPCLHRRSCQQFNLWAGSQWIHSQLRPTP